MRKIVRSCFGEGSPTVKLVTRKEEREIMVLGSDLRQRKSVERESQSCLPVREGLSPFIVQLSACKGPPIAYQRVGG